MNSQQELVVKQCWPKKNKNKVNRAKILYSYNINHSSQVYLFSCFDKDCPTKG